jgi:sterol 3beta-glucosyltransferase
MKITILTYGSRGDVQPFVALAVGLQKAGHDVRLAAPARFEGFVRHYGVDFSPLAGDPNVISLMLNDAGTNVYRIVAGMRDYVFEIATDVVRDTREAVEWADLIVHSFLFTTGGHSIAREMGIPDISVQAFPIFAPTRAFASVAIPDTRIGWLNYFSHWFFSQVFWHGGNAGYYQLRRKSAVGFPKKVFWPFRSSIDRVATPLLLAFSPVVVPCPAEWVAPDIQMTGYFFLDADDFQPPPILQNFMAAGAAPVCVTFGSMVNRDAERVTRVILDCLQNVGLRGIFLTGWGGWKPENPPPSTLFIDEAPHDWLFPRCRAIVHHGGAGTTAAGLRAGAASIVVPHTADQPFWGRRVAALGVGPAPIPVLQVSKQNFMAALALVESDGVRQRAAQIGALIRAEDGIASAVRLIEQHAVEFKRSNRRG